MKSVQKTGKPEETTEEGQQLSLEIIHLLDLLARIEMRRQAKQQLTDKDKSS